MGGYDAIRGGCGHYGGGHGSGYCGGGGEGGSFGGIESIRTTATAATAAATVRGEGEGVETGEEA